MNSGNKMAAGRDFKLCADDYALTPAVSLGILEAVEAGRIDATGAMTTRPFWRTAAHDLASLGDAVQVGLHLDLTLGPPLTRAPRLAPKGRLPSIGRWIRMSRAGALPEAEIRAEIAAQVQAFGEHYGAPPSFVDGHQHVHMLPGIRDWLLDELNARGWTGKLWLRDSSDRLERILRRRVEAPKALLVKVAGQGFAKLAHKRGFSTNEGFSGFSAFDPRRDYSADFARFLVAPGPRHLIMCHPGRVDSELERLDPVTYTREQELEFLLSDRFEDMMAAR
ncbi:MAG: ChbG/HpnK family deacetylase [Beijerinckiaceae bacterium]|jgi:chitin disaccharide deacetylase|nr:ChbG/HpnK family deacetylase [Beijerinckiaceae bacterium]